MKNSTSDPNPEIIGDHFFEEVKSICTISRQGSYGDPWQMHDAISKIWTWYLQNNYPGIQLRPFDAATMLALMKIARIAQAPFDASLADSIKDLAGYSWVMDKTQPLDHLPPGDCKKKGGEPE